jgi:hypothetical protein
MIEYPNLMQATNYAAVVEDVDTVSKTLSIALEPLGIRPWRIYDKVQYGKGRGPKVIGGGGASVVKFATTKLVSQPGEIQLTLIQPLEGDSIWGRYLKEYGNSWHHIEFIESVEKVEQIAKDFEKAGAKKVFEFEFADGRRGYYFDLDGVVFAVSPTYQYLPDEF